MKYPQQLQKYIGEFHEHARSNHHRGPSVRCSLFYVLLSRSLKKREAERMQGEEPEAASAE